MLAPSSATATSSRPRSVETRAASGDLELIAAILRPGILVMPIRDGTTLAEAHRLDARRGDAALGEIPLRARCATLTQGDVVLDRAALIGVAGDANRQVRIRHQHGDLRVQGRTRGVLQIRLVEIEMK